jgi:hypothetical protein
MCARQRRWTVGGRVLVRLVAMVSLRALLRASLRAPLAVMVAVGPAIAAEPWEQVLGQQLDLEQKCILTSTYNVQEWSLGNEMVISGKARCHDGREFEFSQKKNHLKFDIKACEPTVC